ncbi:hypothetical protein D3C78_1348860 [compost metagenome]
MHDAPALAAGPGLVVEMQGVHQVDAQGEVGRRLPADRRAAVGGDQRRGGALQQAAQRGLPAWLVAEILAAGRTVRRTGVPLVSALALDLDAGRVTGDDPRRLVLAARGGDDQGVPLGDRLHPAPRAGDVGRQPQVVEAVEPRDSIAAGVCHCQRQLVAADLANHLQA